MRSPVRLIDTRPLRSAPVFRRIWLGMGMSALGGQLTVVAVLHQVWVMTHSPAAVGGVGLVRALPMLTFSVVGGAWADTIDRRRLVLLTTAGQLLASAMLCAQALMDVGSVAGVLALVAVQATFEALGAPACRTFPARLLPADQLSAGIALNHLSFQLAFVAGPALAGAVIFQYGVIACYALDTVTFVVAMYVIGRAPAVRPFLDAGAPTFADAWHGWRLIAGQPVLRGAFLTDVLATVLAMPVALFPVINAERFGGDPQTLGLFLSAIAAGGIVGGVFCRPVSGTSRPGGVMLVSAVVWGVALGGFGLADVWWLALGCLAVAGAADSLSVISRGSIVQLVTPDSHRGRVSAIEAIVGVSGPDLGNYRAGLVASATSASAAVISGAVLSVLCISAVALANKPLRRFRPDFAPSTVTPAGSSR